MKRLKVGVYEIVMPDHPSPGQEVQVLVIDHRTGEVEEGRMRMVPDEDGSYTTALEVLEKLSRRAGSD